MLQPKRTKYRRPQKGRCKGNAQRGNQLAFGSFGIKSLQTHWLTGRQIEAARVAMTRYMQREGQSWIRIFPDKPITKKPADVRMGKGKGDPVGYVFPITPGRIILKLRCAFCGRKGGSSPCRSEITNYYKNSWYVTILIKTLNNEN